MNRNYRGDPVTDQISPVNIRKKAISSFTLRGENNV